MAAKVATMPPTDLHVQLPADKQIMPRIVQEVKSMTDEDADDTHSIASDPEVLEVEPEQNPDITKREAQKAAFDKHVHAQQDSKNHDHPDDANERDRSSQIRQSESDRIIDKVRDYQQELFERAKEENVIAVLDTGSGKTLIACLLIRHVLDQECVDRAEGKRQRIVFFIANSVHLVQQQARVLTDNLIEMPIMLHGNARQDLWKASTWTQIKEHNKIVVCTPAILDQCLMHSFLDMQDISLLVFDEAHHAKKDHPYSRLIRSYYLKCQDEVRPKIFGMTASAVDSKGDIAQTAQNLEELLHAKIVTTDDGSLLSFAPKPTDVKWHYPRLRPAFNTDMHEELWGRVSFCQDLKRGFAFSTKAVVELGPWCANRVWKFIFGGSAYESSSVRRKYEQSPAYSSLNTVEEREQALVALDDATLLVQSHLSDPVQNDSQDLSAKVRMLVEKLTEHYQHNSETRAIVFVEERLKALILHDSFIQLAVPNVRCGVLLGIAGNSFEAVSMKHQEQMLQRFRAGLINLVFATSVADEGLDIPQCNLCVRFDLCKTTIQYMQSKGRARMAGSIFAHMIEDGTFKEVSEVDYQIADEQYIKRWCGSLAPDRRLGQGTQLNKLLSRDSAGQRFKTESGAICDFSNSMLILARFAASLRHTGAADREVYTEEIDVDKTLFRYVVRLPDNADCHVKGCRGDWKPNKQLAKRSAAWGCCALLRSKKYQYLNDNLDSVFRKFKPENANAHLAVSAKKAAYDMQIKPTAWEAQLDVLPSKLYATILSFRAEQPLRHKLAPLVVLTKTPLPVMPPFSAYLEENTRVEVVAEPISTTLSVSPADVELLTTFTLNGVFDDVFNKVYKFVPEKMSYWLAPVAQTVSPSVSSIKDIVDMSALEVALGERTKWQPGAAADIWANSFLCDPLNGKFHYFTADIVPDAKITDPVPDYVPHISQKKRRNIIDFSNSLWTASKKKAKEEQWYDQDQPVFSADLIGLRRNFLDPEPKNDLIPCLIAPQTLEVARIGADFAASCLVWPALIHRIESYMIVLEAFEKLDLPGIPTGLALEAFTKDADNEEEEQQTHTGGKRGMGKNYERLEFIGDSLLKMTTTMTVFNRTTCDEEGMHCRRMAILCNRNLYNVATSDDLQLYRYARTRGFDRTTWYPEFVKLLRGRGATKDPGANKHPPISQDLGMKTIADMSEAIIGAAVTAKRDSPLDNNLFDLGIRAITKVVRCEDHDVDSWADIAAQNTIPPWALQTNDPIANDRARFVAAKTGYIFKHPRLLRSAFTHSSDTNSPVPDLQRLEFLGDAVLDWVCISWLFNTNPTRNPQWLTEHKMAMVSNKFLAALAVTLDFDKFIFLTTAKLIGDIQMYATKVREAMRLPECPKNFWTDIEAPPKALSDLVESYLGAVLVDSGFDYAEIEGFFNKFILHFFANISDYDSFANRHPTTYLYNKLGQEYKCRDYAIRDSGDPTNEGGIEVEILAGVLVHGVVIAEAKGTSARYARVRASKRALTLMDGLNREEFRKKFRCSCAAKDT